MRTMRSRSCGAEISTAQDRATAGKAVALRWTMAWSVPPQGPKVSCCAFPGSRISGKSLGCCNCRPACVNMAGYAAADGQRLTGLGLAPTAKHAHAAVEDARQAAVDNVAVPPQAPMGMVGRAAPATAPPRAKTARTYCATFTSPATKRHRPFRLSLGFSARLRRGCTPRAGPGHRPPVAPFRDRLAQPARITVPCQGIQACPVPHRLAPQRLALSAARPAV